MGLPDGNGWHWRLARQWRAARRATPDQTPTVIVIAGPNGAGKSTAAPFLLQRYTNIREFVNADLIASGLSPFQPETVSMAAGRIMLARVRELADERATFAFETTLASRTFAPWIKKLTADGYNFHLFFLYLPNAEAAKSRVKRRIALGGHSVPEKDIDRRYGRGIWNLLNLYIPLATSWFVYNSMSANGLRRIASGTDGAIDVIEDSATWDAMRRDSEQVSEE